jgi:Spy/CpxP family protein refolding chaperone
MKMHKLSLGAALALGSLLVCTLTASAQDANTNAPKRERRGPPSVEQRVDRLSTELKLTDEQKTKVTALFEDDAKKMRELRSDKNLTREEQREKFRSMRSESESKLKQILTPEQWEKHQQRMRPGRPTAPDGEKKSDNNKSDKSE